MCGSILLLSGDPGREYVSGLSTAGETGAVDVAVGPVTVAVGAALVLHLGLGLILRRGDRTTGDRTTFSLIGIVWCWWESWEAEASVWAKAWSLALA